MTLLERGRVTPHHPEHTSEEVEAEAEDTQHAEQRRAPLA